MYCMCMMVLTTPQEICRTANRFVQPQQCAWGILPDSISTLMSKKGAEKQSWLTHRQDVNFRLTDLGQFSSATMHQTPFTNIQMNRNQAAQKHTIFNSNVTLNIRIKHACFFSAWHKIRQKTIASTVKVCTPAWKVT